MPEFRGKRVTDERLQGIKRIDRIQSLDLLDTSVTDEGIAILSKATDLREISIRSQVLTDACMETLCALPALVSLLIHDAPLITDRGIAHLKQRESLRELYLDGTQLTDGGIRSFTHLEMLGSLSLERTWITDKGSALLAPLPNLGLLSLKGTAVVGYGLCELPDPPRDIYLDGCPVTDNAVIEMARQLSDLRRLSLKDTGITDVCLPALAELEEIDLLRLTGTHVTDDGAAEFRGHPTLCALEVGGTLVTEAERMRLKKLSPVEGFRVSL